MNDHRAAAVQEITVLLSNADVQTRQAGANGLEYTHAREAVLILIGLLLVDHRWVRWRKFQGNDSKIHGMAESMA